MQTIDADTQPTEQPALPQDSDSVAACRELLGTIAAHVLEALTAPSAVG